MMLKVCTMTIQRKPKSNTPKTAETDEAVARFIAGTTQSSLSAVEPDTTAQAPKAKKKTPVTMKFDPELLARIDRAASKAGVSRTAWLSMKASAALEGEGG